MNGLRRAWQWTTGRGVLFGCVALLLAVVVFFELIFPRMAQSIVGAPNHLPVPRTLYLWYVVIIVIAEAVYVLSSDQVLAEFLEPLKRAARGDVGRQQAILFKIVLVLIPLIVGIGVFSKFVVDTELPAVVRQQHPGMSSANAAPYQGKPNPLRQPSAALLAEFKARYLEAEGPEDEVDPRPKKVESGELDDARLAELFHDDVVRRGRDLYFKNCIPCHGSKLDGDGHSSYAWSLPPIDFREAGTLETLVEDAVLWRLAEGGVGLPPIATPWDSAMPRWKNDMSELEMWKVITALYVDSGVEPRVLEFRAGEGGQGEP